MISLNSRCSSRIRTTAQRWNNSEIVKFLEKVKQYFDEESKFEKLVLLSRTCKSFQQATFSIAKKEKETMERRIVELNEYFEQKKPQCNDDKAVYIGIESGICAFHFALCTTDPLLAEHLEPSHLSSETGFVNVMKFKDFIRTKLEEFDPNYEPTMELKLVEYIFFWILKNECCQIYSLKFETESSFVLYLTKSSERFLKITTNQDETQGSGMMDDIGLNDPETGEVEDLFLNICITDATKRFTLCKQKTCKLDFKEDREMV
mmetsp:Transcript_29603/g.38102  ORF Transcript_29603/g.38102 Transcript_29603/m.38102 type:complete len:262 (-) Transcript_29603:268-1053(-)